MTVLYGEPNVQEKKDGRFHSEIGHLFFDYLTLSLSSHELGNIFIACRDFTRNRPVRRALGLGYPPLKAFHINYGFGPTLYDIILTLRSKPDVK
jgi:hypothetical protein